MPVTATTKMTSRDDRIYALLEWAHRNGAKCGDMTVPPKLRLVARTWFPSTRDEPLSSYVEAVLRILNLEEQLPLK